MRREIGRLEIRRREIPLGLGKSPGPREVPPYDRRVKVTVGVTFAPELAEAIKESAERQGLSMDGWIVAAAGLKFRADDEAEVFEEAARKRRLTGGYDGGVRQTCADSSVPAVDLLEKSLAREMNYLFTVLQDFGVE